jgi:hypothetical protein
MKMYESVTTWKKNYLYTYYAFHWYVHSAFFSRFRTAFDVRRRPGYKYWRLFKFSSILLSFKTRHWLFILIYINFGKFKLQKAPNFVTRPASNVDRRTLFGSEKKMRSAHISEMRSKADFHSVEKVARSTFCEIQAIKRNGWGWLYAFEKKVIAKSQSRDFPLNGNPP